jgi:hypothetical protein
MTITLECCLCRLHDRAMVRQRHAQFTLGERHVRGCPAEDPLGMFRQLH